MKIFRVFDKTGTIGVFISALGCAGCFPAFGSLSSVLGLSAFSRYEGIFITKLLPAFAIIALVANIFGWYQHRVHYRGTLSIIGPIIVLLAIFPFWQYEWSVPVFYTGLLFMGLISLIDLVKPAKAPQCKI